MKKLILSLGLLAGVSVAAHAQTGIHFGIKAGASLTNFTGKDVEGAANKFGFNGGVVANFGLNDMFSIQPEVLYSMKGAKEDGGDGKINLNYIDIPVLAKIATGKTGLFFELGPQVGFLASAKAKDSNTSQDVKDAFKNVDFGYAAGVGFQVASSAMIGLRYNGGFTDVYKSVDFLGTNVETKAKNSAFQLYVGYMFGGK
ncbi:MAG: porin family protein [Janthinobacterium lividum]